MKCKLLVSELLCAAMLLGCSSAPKLSLPAGEWEEVDQPGAIPPYNVAAPNIRSVYTAPAPVVSVPPPSAPISLNSPTVQPVGPTASAGRLAPVKASSAVVATSLKATATEVAATPVKALTTISAPSAAKAAPVSVAPSNAVPAPAASSASAVTAARSVPVPTPPKPPLQTWTAAVGSTLHQTVAEWCKRAGVRLIWNQEDLDYPIEAPLSFKGSFPEAIDQIFPLYDGAKRSFLVDGNTSSQGILYVSERKK